MGPDTSVVLYNKPLGFERTMTTTDDGVFYAPGLVSAPGYGLRVTRKGFVDWETRDFKVSLGQTLNFKIALRPGTTTAQVDTGGVLA